MADETKEAIDLSQIDEDESIERMREAEARGKLDLSRGLYSDVVQSPHEKTLIDCGGGVIVECEIYQYSDEPPVIDFVCPQCRQKLMFNGKTKEIRIDRFPKRPKRFSDGSVYLVSRAVSVHGAVKCSYPSQCGKGLCGWRAQIRDGVAARV